MDTLTPSPTPSVIAGKITPTVVALVLCAPVGWWLGTHFDLWQVRGQAVVVVDELNERFAPRPAVDPNTTELDWRGVDLSPDRLNDLQLKPHLTTLDLRASTVSDNDLDALAALRQLQSLDLRATKVSEGGLRRLRSALPSTVIRHDSDPATVARTMIVAPFARRTLRGDGIVGPRGSGLGAKGGRAIVGWPVPDPEIRPEPSTETAIDHGTTFLSRHQSGDGSWSFGAGDESTGVESRTAATGLTLLSMLGAGHDHQHGVHAPVVRRGLDYLIGHQKPDGDLYADRHEASAVVWLYSHGIATIALSEAYGMTQDESLREPAQRAIEFIVAAQHPQLGGWRYEPGVGCDTSVTGWLAMALHSGRLAGLDVPDRTLRRIAAWFDMAQASSQEPHLFVYNPYASETEAKRHGRAPNPTMSAVGLLMRMYQGWRRDDPRMQAGADYLLQHLPAHGDATNPLRDAYYWYYATQVMLHMRGDHWKRWNDRIHPLLIESQLQSGPHVGSWSPTTPVPDRWAPQAGRLYVTTLNLLTLEVFYRHLPIFEDAAR